jgi:flagellar hook assembly protein FlgD
MVSQMVSLNQLDQLISINETLSSLTSSAASTNTPATNAAQSSRVTADAATPAASAQTNSVVQQPATAFQGGQPYTGSLMNLYSNIGATAANSNHFTAAGGR